MSAPKGKSQTTDVSAMLKSWQADVLPSQPPGYVGNKVPTEVPSPPITEHIIKGKPSPPPYVPMCGRDYVLRYPPPPGDGQVKLGATVWISQREFLKRAAVDCRSTVQDLVREALDDFRAKLEAERLAADGG